MGVNIKSIRFELNSGVEKELIKRSHYQEKKQDRDSRNQGKKVTG